jgi:hypothetical protein
MATTYANKEAVWLHKLCSGIEFKEHVMIINCDSQSAILNPTYHSRMKHIDVQYHFMGDMIQSKKVLLEKVNTLENIANSLTNYVSVVKFSWCREEMGISTMSQ